VLGGCPPGEARLTAGYRLAAHYVIHTVGPIWRGGDQGERALLASCYRNSLELAARHGVTTIAFPAISCGAYGFPLELAIPVAVDAVREFAQRDLISRIVFANPSERLTQAYRAFLASSRTAP
jgi:O-acetyl-ADP-ribose deacetylase (regulator of RNase III)